MTKSELKKNYWIWQYETEKECFDTLKLLLEDGYHISDTVYLCVEVCKDEHFILLSYLPLPKLSENFKDEIRSLEKQMKLVRPNFQKCMLNIVASIRHYFGKTSPFATDKRVDMLLEQNKIKNIFILLLDGLGMNILDYHLGNDSFLCQHLVDSNTAVYPSTTAASTTSTINGLAPIETAWLGWENYFKEIDRDIILFNGRDYYTGEATGFDAYEVLPFKPFFEDLPVCGKIIQPDFTVHRYPITEVFKRSLELIDDTMPNIQYLYFTEPDSSMHELGPYHRKITQICEELDVKVKNYASLLPKESLLIISADHGHTAVNELQLYQCTILMDMLKRKPSNEGRCIFFSVKDEFKAVFSQLFKQIYGYAYEIYPTQKLIEKEFFGLRNSKIHPRSLEFFGDFIAIATKDFYFNYAGPGGMVFKSHHAGITADEMLVPLILFRK